MLDDYAQYIQRIKNVLSGVERWESMPNRRESVTAKMVLPVLKKCDGKHLDSLELVLCDWDMLGIFRFFLLCECSQKASDRKQSLTSVDGLPITFIFPDLNFMGADRHAIP